MNATILAAGKSSQFFPSLHDEPKGIESWVGFCTWFGDFVKPFAGRGFDGATRFVNRGKAATPERLPELYGSKSECCGCTACAYSCPKGAIAMLPDEGGFLYPVVDAAICVGCRACLRVCPLKG